MVALISVIVFIFGIWNACRCKTNTPYKAIALIGFILLASIGFLGTIIGACVPSGGYQQSVVEEVYELIPCIIDDKEVYVMEVDGNYVCFKNTVVISADGKTTVPDAQYLQNVEIVEEAECKMPRVEKRVEEPKEPFWTCTRMSTRVTYIIYIPVGMAFEG